MGTESDKRQKYVKRGGQLKLARSSWDASYKEIAQHIAPRRQRFFTSDTNKGTKREQSIVNNTPTRALDTTASGMQSGLTSQSRPWFHLAAPTPELSEVAAVKDWLHSVEVTMREVIARSNAYNSFHMIYGDLGGFGTAALWVEEDVEEVIRTYVFSVGQYCIFLDARGRVAGVFRETSMTVGQLVEMFTLEKCSTSVQEMHKNDQLDMQIDVTHVIEKNTEYQSGKMGPKGMLFTSCWFETIGDGTAGMLREAGFEEMPGMFPRWQVNSEDTYGSSPGMEVLGDCKALQLLEKRSAQAFDKVVNPPMTGPTSLNGQRISLLPGDVTYVDSMSPGSAFRPAHEVNGQALPAFEQKIANHERRINAGFHADLWLTMQRIDAGRMTAAEVNARTQEQMILLGPVVERQQDELHSPFIDRVFGICLRRGMFPPPPPELQGFDLKIEYTSIMAQAQKLIGTTAIERLASFVGNLAAVKVEVLDMVDFDKAVSEYASMLGVPPSLVQSDEKVQALRADRAQQKAQQAQMMQAANMVQGAQTLSQTDVAGPNALNAMLSQIGAKPGQA